MPPRILLARAVQIRMAHFAVALNHKVTVDGASHPVNLKRWVPSKKEQHTLTRFEQLDPLNDERTAIRLKPTRLAHDHGPAADVLPNPNHHLLHNDIRRRERNATSDKRHICHIRHRSHDHQRVRNLQQLRERFVITREQPNRNFLGNVRRFDLGSLRGLDRLTLRQFDRRHTRVAAVRRARRSRDRNSDQRECQPTPRT